MASHLAETYSVPVILSERALMEARFQLKGNNDQFLQYSNVSWKLTGWLCLPKYS